MFRSLFALYGLLAVLVGFLVYSVAVKSRWSILLAAFLIVLTTLALMLLHLGASMPPVLTPA